MEVIYPVQSFCFYYLSSHGISARKEVSQAYHRKSDKLEAVS